MSLLWPIASLANAARAALRDKPVTLKSAVWCFGIYFAAALRHNALPEVLQRFHAQAGLDPRQAPHLLYSQDGRAWRLLNAQLGANGDDVQDKGRFAAVCAAHGLPAIPTIAAFESGKPLGPVDMARALERSLFVKALRGRLGEGAEIWRFEEGGYSNGTTRHATLDDLLEALSAEDCIVQPLMRDNADLRRAGSDGLSSLRLVTFVTATGETQVACALLLLAKGMLSQNGEYFGVSIADGRLNTWFDQAAKVVRQRTAFPNDFALEAIADWDGLVELVRHAHAVGFPRFATLGWDLALTDEGAFLLEANQGWGMALHQMFDAPMGLGPIGLEADRWATQLQASLSSPGAGA